MNAVDTDAWIDAGALEARCADQALRSLLCERGSLTHALRGFCGSLLTLKVVAQHRAQFTALQSGSLDAADGWLREILLCCGTSAWVFGQTLVPAATLSEHPWLRELEGRPLGDLLFARDDVTRSEFLFTQLVPAQTLHARVAPWMDDPDETLWARRSQFRIGDRPLLVNEVFLPRLVRILP